MAPKTTPTTTTYLLRDVDAALWASFRERAESDGASARDALLLLVAAYTNGQIKIERRAPLVTTGATRRNGKRRATRNS